MKTFTVIRKKAAALLLLGCMMTLAAPGVVFAAQSTEQVVTKDLAGNQFGAGQEITLTGEMLDGCAAGMKVNMADVKADGTLAAAGYNVAFKNCTVNGTVFAAGYSVDLIDSSIKNNLIATGNKINITENFTAGSVIATGGEVIFNGTADYVNLSGENVIINGTINKSATVQANSVSFGPDARVEGDMKVSAVHQPEAKGVVQGEYTFEEMMTEEEIEQAVKEGKEESFFEKVRRTAMGRVYWLAAMTIAALLIILVFGKNVEEAGKKFVEEPAKVVSFGAIALVCTPMAILFLAITIIGLPSAGLLLMIYLLILFASQTFAGAALGRHFLADRINHAILSSLIGVAVLLIIDVIPWVGTLSSVACAIFTFGYIAVALTGKKSTVETGTSATSTVVTDAEAENSVGTGTVE